VQNAVLLKKIFVVEDDRNISALLHHILEGNGYTVENSFDGREALGKLEYYQPDLIILDVNLPSISGIQLLEALKASKKTASIPVLMCTERSLIGDIETALAIGAEAYITKPFAPDRLIRKIEELMQKQKI
jgi:DNA-binding response OmpR family regulator